MLAVLLILAVGFQIEGQPHVAPEMARPVDALVEASTTNLPQCLSRFLDYPPGPGKPGLPRSLFENPFPRNPVFWLKDVDLTCVSPWNDSYGKLRAGTAISKRHVVFAKHFPLSVGTRIAFVGESGDVSHYTVKATKALSTSDIMIGLLDYELTPDVHPAKILPVAYEQVMKSGTTWPVVTFNQNEQVFLSDVLVCPRSQPGEVTMLNLTPKKEAWQKFAGVIVGGDSGNPAFLLYRGRPVLVYCLKSDGRGNGPKIHEHRVEVQRAMDNLCPGYRLEEFDLSAR